jgi:hypothetical protein
MNEIELQAITASVRGTEAVVFGLTEEKSPILPPLCHIRGESADDATRQRAVEAFLVIAKRHLDSQQDAVVELVGPALPRNPSKFCLVSFRGLPPNSLLMIIVRSWSNSEARLRHRLLMKRLSERAF